MKNIFVLLSILTTSFAFTQTKLISHKSHSGARNTFSKSLTHHLFDIGESNFGMAPTRIVCMAKLDTLEFLSDSVTIVKTSAEEKRMPWSPYTENEMDKIRHLWRPGADTVVNHPLFSKKTTKDSIKIILEKDYNFVNKPKDVVFIDRTKKIRNSNNKTAEENKFTPVQKKKKRKKKGSNGGIAFMILFVVSSIVSITIHNRKSQTLMK